MKTFFKVFVVFSMMNLFAVVAWAGESASTGNTTPACGGQHSKGTVATAVKEQPKAEEPAPTPTETPKSQQNR